jgi:hypothetical protein
MRDVARFRVGRYHDHRDACAIAEKAEWLHITGVIVSSAFVEGDEDRGVGSEGGVRLDRRSMVSYRWACPQWRRKSP